MIERLRAWWVGSDPDEVRQAWAQADVWMRRAKRAEAELARMKRPTHGHGGSANCPTCSRDAAERANRVWVDDDAGSVHLEALCVALAAIAVVVWALTAWTVCGWIAVAVLGAAYLINLRDDDDVDPIEQRHAADRALRNEYPE